MGHQGNRTYDFDIIGNNGIGIAFNSNLTLSWKLFFDRKYSCNSFFISANVGTTSQKFNFLSLYCFERNEDAL